MTTRTRELVLQVVQAAIKEVENLKEAPTETSLLRDTCPDSLGRVEIRMELEDHLGLEIHDTFMDDHVNSTVGDFATALFKLGTAPATT